MFLHIPSNLAHDCPNSKALEAVLWSKVQLTALNSVSNSLVFVHLPIIRSKTSVSPHSPDRAFGAGNLLFNTVMESGDHGPFNSWDRQVGWPPFPPSCPLTQLHALQHYTGRSKLNARCLLSRSKIVDAVTYTQTFALQGRTAWVCMHECSRIFSYTPTSLGVRTREVPKRNGESCHSNNCCISSPQHMIAASHPLIP